MRGTYHLTLSIVIGLMLYFPLISIGSVGILPTFLSLLLILTIAWGSLVPDVDVTGSNKNHPGHSKIFYEYPTVAKFFNWGIYVPLAKILKEQKHRGFMHSLEGAVLTVVLFLGYIFVGFIGVGIVLMVYPTIIEGILSGFENIENMVINELYILVAIFIVGLGLFSGIIMHLFEDTLTVSGIEWRWYGEKTWKLKGNVRVGDNYETYLAMILIGEGVIILLIQYSYNNDLLMQFVFGIIGLILIVGTGLVSTTTRIGNLIGDDKKEIDARTRSLAEKNKIAVSLGSGLTINTDKNRIKRGLSISKNDVNLKEKTVNKYLSIEDKETHFTCTCKDFKNMGDFVMCKHIIAYLAKKDQTYLEMFEKIIE